MKRLTKKAITLKILKGRKKWWRKADLQRAVIAECISRGIDPSYILDGTIGGYLWGFRCIKRQVGPNTWEYRLR